MFNNILAMVTQGVGTSSSYQKTKSERNHEPKFSAEKSFDFDTIESLMAVKRQKLTQLLELEIQVKQEISNVHNELDAIKRLRLQNIKELVRSSLAEPTIKPAEPTMEETTFDTATQIKEQTGFYPHEDPTKCNHPERKPYAKGMCHSCYQRKGNSKLASKCAHP